MRHKMPGVDAWGNCCRCGQEVRHSGGCDCCSHEMYIMPPPRDTKDPVRQDGSNGMKSFSRVPNPKKDDGVYWCSFDDCPAWDGKHCSITHLKCRMCDDPVLCGGVALYFEQRIDAIHGNIRERLFVDLTPNEELPVRILDAYIDESFTSDNTMGLPPENPLIIEMEKSRKERNRILREATDVILRKDSRG